VFNINLKSFVFWKTFNVNFLFYIIILYIGINEFFFQFHDVVSLATIQKKV
jgi:hypothetical protein